MEGPTMELEKGGDGERSSGGGASLSPPHVVVFPFPVQGHVTPMLMFAELLSLLAIRVTFLISDYNRRRLLGSAGVRARLARRPRLHLLPFSDGLSEDNPRDASRLVEISEALEANARRPFRELLGNGAPAGDGAAPVTCVVADGLIGFPPDIADELGVPILAFRTSSACSFLAYQSIPALLAGGIIPFREGCLGELARCVPGMESFLRLGDLPSFCRVKDVDDPAMLLIRRIVRIATTRYRGLVLNTAEFVEDSALSHIRRLIPSTYPIGPLHGLMQAAVAAHSGGAAAATSRDAAASSSYSSCSLREEDRTCLEWLDRRADGSVVFVSFGSIALLKTEELHELWHGLVDSGFHFLWVARPGLVEDGGGAVDPVVSPETATDERGIVVRWAPQREVLAHRAVGCFLTHSGWNSTLESMWAGVPMVCWPCLADQLVNSRFVGEVWKIGVDVKDTCDRAAVEKAVREVMAADGPGSKMREAAAGMSMAMRECVGEGGSSYRSLHMLMGDIWAMTTSA